MQKFENLSKEVLVELAATQETHLVALKRDLQHEKQRQRVLVRESLQTEKESIQTLLAGCVENVQVNFRKLDARVSAMHQRLVTHERQLHSFVDTMRTKHEGFRDQIATQKDRIQQILHENSVKPQSCEIGVQCERPKTSLVWQEELEQSMIQQTASRPHRPNDGDGGRTDLVDGPISTEDSGPTPSGQKHDNDTGEAQPNGGLNPGRDPLLDALDSPLIKHLITTWIDATKPPSTESSAGYQDLILSQERSIADQVAPGKKPSRLQFLTQAFPSSRRPAASASPPPHLANLEGDLESFLLGDRPANYGTTPPQVQGESNRAAYSILMAWLRMVLDDDQASKLEGCMHAVEINNLPKEIYDGFLLHLFPILAQKKGLVCNVYKRVRDVYDIKFTATQAPVGNSATVTRDDLESHANDAAGLSSSAPAPSSGLFARASQLINTKCRACNEKRKRLVNGGPGDDDNPWGTVGRIHAYQYCEKCTALVNKQATLGASTAIRRAQDDGELNSSTGQLEREGKPRTPPLSGQGQALKLPRNGKKSKRVAKIL